MIGAKIKPRHTSINIGCTPRWHCWQLGTPGLRVTASLTQNSLLQGQVLLPAVGLTQKCLDVKQQGLTNYS